MFGLNSCASLEILDHSVLMGHYNSYTGVIKCCYTIFKLKSILHGTISWWSSISEERKHVHKCMSEHLSGDRHWICQNVEQFSLGGEIGLIFRFSYKFSGMKKYLILYGQKQHLQLFLHMIHWGHIVSLFLRLTDTNLSGTGTLLLFPSGKWRKQMRRVRHWEPKTDTLITVVTLCCVDFPVEAVPTLPCSWSGG